MKKLIIFLIIILTLGIGCVVISAATGTNIKDIIDLYDDSSKYERKENNYTISSTDINIDLNLDDRSVYLEKSNDADIHLLYYTYLEKEKFELNFNDVSNTLKIYQKSERWFSFGFSRGEVLRVYIYLPEALFIENANINLSDGKFNINSQNEFNNLEIEQNNAKLKLENVITKTLKVSLDNGSFDAYNTTSDNFIIDADNGTVNLNRSTINNNLNIDASNGGVYVNDTVITNQLMVKARNGRVELRNVNALNITTNAQNGRVTFDNVSAVTVKIDSSNGRVVLNNGIIDNLDIKSQNGKVEMNFNNLSQNDYYIFLKSGHSNIYVNDEKTSGAYVSGVATNNKKINVVSSNGSIVLNINN